MAGKGKIVIGVAGNAGSGKSELTALFGRLGARVISADRIGRDCLREKRTKEKLVNKFGESIIDRRGAIDRGRLADLVFGRTGHRRFLNRCIHPELLRRMKREIAAVRDGVVVVDAALLFDWRIDKWFDWTILVTASRANKLNRLMRRGFSHRRASRVLGCQMDDRRADRRADLVVVNDGSKAALMRQGRIIFKGLTK